MQSLNIQKQQLLINQDLTVIWQRFQLLWIKNDAILSDELNHASIIDGSRLSKSKKLLFINILIWKIYAKKAIAAKESGLYNKLMVITDGVFSMDGDVAKLPEIVEIAEELDLMTYVDDAHGSGVLGKGAGTVKHFGLSDKVDFQIGTLSKSNWGNWWICSRETKLN